MLEPLVQLLKTKGPVPTGCSPSVPASMALGEAITGAVHIARVRRKGVLGATRWISRVVSSTAVIWSTPVPSEGVPKTKLAYGMSSVRLGSSMRS